MRKQRSSQFCLCALTLFRKTKNKGTLLNPQSFKVSEYAKYLLIYLVLR